MLETVEQCGACEMTFEETAIILGLELDEFLSNSEYLRAYKKGQLETKFNIRKSIINLARDGVPAMVKMYIQMSEVQEITPLMNETPKLLNDLDETIEIEPEEDDECELT